MAVQPRSQVLIHGNIAANAGTLRFTCPAGYVTLVKSAYAVNNAGSTAQIYVSVWDTAGPTGAVMIGPALAPGAWASWEGWIVLNPGYYVQVYSAVAGVIFHVSGAVLLGLPPFPPNV